MQNPRERVIGEENRARLLLLFAAPKEKEEERKRIEFEIIEFPPGSSKKLPMWDASVSELRFRYLLY